MRSPCSPTRSCAGADADDAPTLVRHAPAADRPGDGQGRRGHGVLPRHPLRRAQRGRRRPRPLRRRPSPRSTHAQPRRPRTGRATMVDDVDPRHQAQRGRAGPARRAVRGRRRVGGDARPLVRRAARRGGRHGVAAIRHSTCCSTRRWSAPTRCPPERATPYLDKAMREAKRAHLVARPRRGLRGGRPRRARPRCSPTASTAPSSTRSCRPTPRARPGQRRSAQKLLALTVPGVPDLYQGSELWTSTWSTPTTADRSTTRRAAERWPTIRRGSTSVTPSRGGIALRPRRSGPRQARVVHRALRVRRARAVLRRRRRLVRAAARRRRRRPTTSSRSPRRGRRGRHGRAAGLTVRLAPARRLARHRDRACPTARWRDVLSPAPTSPAGPVAARDARSRTVPGRTAGRRDDDTPIAVGAARPTHGRPSTTATARRGRCAATTTAGGATTVPADGRVPLRRRRRRAPRPALAVAARRARRPVAPDRPPTRSRGPTTRWRGFAARRDAVIYELHVGTFTPEGTFDGAIERLDHLVELGVNARRADAGRRVPRPPGLGLRRRRPASRRTTPTAGPTACKRLVDACHARGLAVVLDVVYNHLGPAGNYLGRVRAVLHRPLPHAVGRRRSTSTAPAATRCAASSSTTPCMWLARLPRRRPAARRRARAPRRRRPCTSSSSSPPRCDALGRALGRPLWLIAESDLNDPRLVRAARGRRLRPRRAVERRLPPRAARRRSPASAAATTPTSAAWPTSPRALDAACFVYDGRYSPSPRARATAGPLGDLPGYALRSATPRTTTRSATAPRGERLAPPRRSPSALAGRGRARAAPRRSCRCCSRARSGRRRRRSSTSPTTTTPSSREAVREGRRARVRRVRRVRRTTCPTRRTPATFDRSVLRLGRAATSPSTPACSAGTAP